MEMDPDVETIAATSADVRPATMQLPAVCTQTNYVCLIQLLLPNQISHYYAHAVECNLPDADSYL